MMTITSYEDRRIQAQAFIEKLDALRQENARREISAMKRNAGNTLTEARGVHWFYRLLDDDGMSAPDAYFLVATLWALNPRQIAGNFGQTCHLLWQKKKSPNDSEKDKVDSAVARRFNILLDADMDGGELAFRLRQFVKLLAAHEVGIDWAQFVLDLRDWQWPGKRVQHQWAQSFYAPNFSGDTVDTSASAAGTEIAKGDSHAD